MDFAMNHNTFMVVLCEQLQLLQKSNADAQKN